MKIPPRKKVKETLNKLVKDPKVRAFLAAVATVPGPGALAAAIKEHRNAIDAQVSKLRMDEIYDAVNHYGKANLNEIKSLRKSLKLTGQGLREIELALFQKAKRARKRVIVDEYRLFGFKTVGKMLKEDLQVVLHSIGFKDISFYEESFYKLGNRVEARYKIGKHDKTFLFSCLGGSADRDVHWSVNRLIDEYSTIYDVIVTVTHGSTHTGSLRRLMEIWGGDFTLNELDFGIYFGIGKKRENKKVSYIYTPRFYLGNVKSRLDIEDRLKKVLIFLKHILGS